MSNSWCEHPKSYLQRIYTPAMTIYTDRLLCGLCGELVYLPQAAEAARPLRR